MIWNLSFTYALGPLMYVLNIFNLVNLSSISKGLDYVKILIKSLAGKNLISVSRETPYLKDQDSFGQVQ